MQTRSNETGMVLSGGDQFSALLEQAQVLIDSGFLPEAIRKPAQAVAIILTGQELGIPKMQALRQINVIKGKPSMGAELMLARAYQTIPGFNHVIEHRTPDACVIVFQATGRTPHKHSFTMADAQQLGLAEKDNYKKQPATMLFWRCVSGGLRAFVPHAVNGVYTPEELAPDLVTVSDTGEAIIPEEALAVSEPPRDQGGVGSQYDPPKTTKQLSTAPKPVAPTAAPVTPAPVRPAPAATAPVVGPAPAPAEQPVVIDRKALFDRAAELGIPRKGTNQELIDAIAAKEKEMGTPPAPTPAPVVEEEAVPMPPIGPDKVAEIVGAYSQFGIDENTLEFYLDKRTADWNDQDRITLLSAWKDIRYNRTTKEAFVQKATG